MKNSNGLLAFLNFLTLLLLSLPILGGGIWVSHRAATECERFVHDPTIILGACFRLKCLLLLYLFAMFLLILPAFCFTVFAFLVTSNGAGKVMGNRGYKEYWAQKRVNNSKNWNRVKVCLIDARVCQSLDNRTKAQEFFSHNLSPIQSGCCKPPEDCDLIYQSPTLWSKNKSIAHNNSSNPDCNSWSNYAKALCFDCESSKAGMLQNVKSQRKRVAVINNVFLVFLIIVYSLGCCAFRNNTWHSRDNTAPPWKP